MNVNNHLFLITFQTLNNASSTETLKTISSPSKLPSNKHIIPADSICVNKQIGVGEFGIVQQGVWTNGNERVSSFTFLTCVIALCV